MSREFKFMSQTEISKNIGCSRANVGQTLRRALKKMYYKTLKENLADTPYEAFEFIANSMNLQMQEDINELYKEMPIEIKKEIAKDAKKRFM